MVLSKVYPVCRFVILAEGRSLQEKHIQQPDSKAAQALAA